MLEERKGPKSSGKRHSAREKKPVQPSDLGYVDKETSRKLGKNQVTTSEGYKRIEKVLTQLKRHPAAPQFMSLTSIPGYNELVKDPMDINMIERNIKIGKYTSTTQFAEDVRKIWSNSWNVNPTNSDLYNVTTEISNFFDKLHKEMGDVQFVPETNIESSESKKGNGKSESGIKQTQTAPAKGAQSAKSKDMPMTTQEKAALKKNIMELTQQQLQGVISIIQNAVDTSKNSETLEFDIDKLPIKVCRDLDAYVKKCITTKAKSAPKKKSAETERPAVFLFQ